VKTYSSDMAIDTLARILGALHNVRDARLTYYRERAMLCERTFGPAAEVTVNAMLYYADAIERGI
jgi:hypothetical protein